MASAGVIDGNIYLETQDIPQEEPLTHLRVYPTDMTVAPKRKCAYLAFGTYNVDPIHSSIGDFNTGPRNTKDTLPSHATVVGDTYRITGAGDWHSRGVFCDFEFTTQRADPGDQSIPFTLKVSNHETGEVLLDVSGVGFGQAIFP